MIVNALCKALSLSQQSVTEGLKTLAAESEMKRKSELHIFSICVHFVGSICHAQNLDFFRWFLSMVRTDRKSRDDSVECVIIILDEGPCSSGNLLVKDVGAVGRIVLPYQSEL